jgi:hypothetical protein
LTAAWSRSIAGISSHGLPRKSPSAYAGARAIAVASEVPETPRRKAPPVDLAAAARRHWSPATMNAADVIHTAAIGSAQRIPRGVSVMPAATRGTPERTPAAAIRPQMPGSARAARPVRMGRTKPAKWKCAPVRRTRGSPKPRNRSPHLEKSTQVPPTGRKSIPPSMASSASGSGPRSMRRRSPRIPTRAVKRSHGSARSAALFPGGNANEARRQSAPESPEMRTSLRSPDERAGGSSMDAKPRGTATSGPTRRRASASPGRMQATPAIQAPQPASAVRIQRELASEGASGSMGPCLMTE